MVSVKLEVHLRELGGLNQTYYRMFTEMAEDTGREGSGWNKYGKMTRKEAGGIRHDSKCLGRTITWLGPGPDPCRLPCLLIKSHP